MSCFLAEMSHQGLSSWQGIAVTNAIDRHSTLLSRGLGWLGKKRGKAQQLLQDFPGDEMKAYESKKNKQGAEFLQDSLPCAVG